jgi:hypothetical protein
MKLYRADDAAYKLVKGKKEKSGVDLHTGN